MSTRNRLLHTQFTIWRNHPRSGLFQTEIFLGNADQVPKGWQILSSW